MLRSAFDCGLMDVHEICQWLLSFLSFGQRTLLAFLHRVGIKRETLPNINDHLWFFLPLGLSTSS